jgi:hypothetical protein
VDLALLEMAANGSPLDAGQASLVRQMCTSGARFAVTHVTKQGDVTERHPQPPDRPAAQRLRT